MHISHVDKLPATNPGEVTTIKSPQMNMKPSKPYREQVSSNNTYFGIWQALSKLLSFSCICRFEYNDNVHMIDGGEVISIYQTIHSVGI